MQAITGGLGPDGVMMVIGIRPLTVDSLDLLMKSTAVRGWYSGIARDSGASGLSKMQRHVDEQKISACQGAEAYNRMMTSKARFHVVLDMGA